MNKVLSILATKKFWKELFVMTFGMLVAAFAVNYFLVPSKLVLGSVTGLSIVITGLLANLGISLKLSVMIFIINAILLMLAYFLVGKEFGIKTVYTALILGPLVEFWNFILPASTFIAEGEVSVMNDPWLDLICFVLVVSISQAILFRINASTGGLDIIAKIVNKYLHLELGTSVTVSGALICCTAFAINPVRLVIIGLVGTWINGLALDYFTASLNKRKRVCIVSDEHERIRKYIIEKLHRGCSLYNLQGGFTKEEHVEIQSLLTQYEFSDLMKFIKTNKINAFITAGNCSEVYGLWNDRKRREEKKVLDE